MAENATSPVKNPADSPSSGARPVPHDDMVFGTTPNILTLVRIGFIPFVVAALFQRTPQWDLIAAILFGVASITDYFDGYLARVQKSVTVYGQLLDPLADKFLVVSCLIALQALDRIHPVVVMLLICRELAITGLRALASAEGVVIPASASAKWKTTFQMAAIPMLMLKEGVFGIPVFKAGLVALYLSLAISLWTAKDYVIDFFRAAKESRKQKAKLRKQAREARLAARAARLAAKAARRPGVPPSDTR